jgi:hypothetical protein
MVAFWVEAIRVLRAVDRKSAVKLRLHCDRGLTFLVSKS